MGERSATWAPRSWDVRRFASIDSTNRWVLQEARAGAAEGLVAVADHQDAGRGRRGRAWVAAPGSSLLVSLLFRPGSWEPPMVAERVHVLTMATGLALADAVRQVGGVDAALKWPNDLVVGDRKLAGMLAEADVSGAGEVRAVVVGVGCNIAQHEFPDELAPIATSCALEAGRDVDRDAVLDAFLDGVDARLGALDAIVGAYRTRLATLGRTVRVDLGAESFVGIAVGIDDLGRLEIETSDGTRRTVSVGDVVHLRPA